jgi:radical SAM superfamily enzyme YgiQ (UPF0313 family)
MKVALICPPFKAHEIYTGLADSSPVLPPLELAYAASYLISKGYQVVLIDAPASDMTLEDISAVIRKEEPELVGIATNSPIFSFIYSLYSRALELAHVIKDINPEIKTLLTGYHPTILPEEALSEDVIDYIILGETEFALEELCLALKNNRCLHNVAGLGYKEGNDFIINKSRTPLIDLDILPMPSFDLLPMHKYRFASDTPVPVKGFSIRASRGCRYNCYFCSAPGFWKNHVGTHSPGYILSIMNYLYEKYKLNRFQFHDDNFGINNQWIEEFCRLLGSNKYNFEWECYSRFDLLNEEKLAIMKKAGCRLISLGVEFGSDEILRKIKGHSKVKIEQGMSLLRKFKIKTRLFFMIGPPSKTEEDIKNTIKYAVKLNPDVFVATISIPFPGSRFYDEMKDIGMAPNFKDRLIPIYESPGDTLGFKKEYLDRMIKYAYRSFYLRPNYILRHIAKIRNIKQLTYYLKGIRYVFNK